MKYVQSLVFLLMTFLVSNGQNRHIMRELKSAVSKELNAQQGQFAVAFYDLNSRKGFSINGDSVFHAASTMKTPVMVEVFKQADQGLFSLNDSLVVKNEFKSIVDGSNYQLYAKDDSDTDIYRYTGRKMRIYDLMYRMIINSSNLATNIIIDLVGARNVMKTLHQLGIHKMKVLRGVEDEKAYEQGLNNVTTANDLQKLFKAIANHQIISPAACDSMIRILEDQKHNDIIPALLPKDVKVAHKTGNITGVEHDSGIVFLPNGKKYILVLLSKGLKDESAGVRAMAQVSRIVYDWINL